MRVLVVVDKEGSAIDRLAKQRAMHMPWHDVRIVSYHPKRPSPQQIKEFTEAYAWCDIVDFQYWKSAEKIKEAFKIERPSLLAHYNPYDLKRQSWDSYDINVVVNEYQYNVLGKRAKLIPLPVDLRYWQAKGDLEKKYDVIMVSNRIEAKKGILPVAQSCKELNLSMLLIGNVSDVNYFEQVVETGVVFFRENISDEDLRIAYEESRIHVCNSIDNFESGTLPILESIAMGIPVISRKVGHVPDIFNGRNLVIRDGEPNDVEGIKHAIKSLINDSAHVKEMTEDARYSIKYRNYEINAWQYSKLYHSLVQRQELVTAILPTCGPAKDIVVNIATLIAQTYGPLEIIVVHDGHEEDFLELIKAVHLIRSETNATIKLFLASTFGFVGKDVVKTYGLARARNIGIMEAEGEWLLFIDDRLTPDASAVLEFYKRRAEGKWLWGIKDAKKKGFVENFSFVKRSDVIKIGMFNERITQYGGMTQDIRTRAERLNKMKMELVESAHAHQVRKSTSKESRYMSIVKSKTQCYKLYG